MSHRPCYWHEDTDGTRFLVPGCLTRINTPDIDECTCPTIADQLASAQERIAQLQQKNDGLQAWHDAIVRAVHDHPAGTQIMRNAARAVSR